MAKRILSMLVEDTPGLLSRVSALFSRRGYNITSLAVGTSDRPGKSRMTIVLDVDQKEYEQVVKQLNKLVNVLRIVDMPAETSICRDYMLIKVRAEGDSLARLMDVVTTYRGRIVDVSVDTAVIEITGSANKLQALLDLLQGFGVLEIAQSGMLAMSRGSRTVYGSKKQDQTIRRPN